MCSIALPRVLHPLRSRAARRLPLRARLRGGYPQRNQTGRRERPRQPTVLVSTIDQVGFAPVVPGLWHLRFREAHSRRSLGNRCTPATGRGTSFATLCSDGLRCTCSFRRPHRGAKTGRRRRSRSIALSATQTGDADLTGSNEHSGRLVRQDDYDHPVLGPRLNALKQAELHRSDARVDGDAFAEEFAARAELLLKSGGKRVSVVGVVVNRVKRARLIFAELQETRCPAVPRVDGPSGGGRGRNSASRGGTFDRALSGYRS